MIGSTLLGIAALLVPAFQADGIDEIQSLYLRGNYAEALERIAAEKPKDAGAAALVAARCLAATGDYAGAETRLRDAVAKEPKNPHLHAELGQIALLQGRLAEAQAAAKAALAIDANHLPARWLEADCLSTKGEFEAASKAYLWFIQRYNAVQPKDAESLYLMGRAAIEYAVRNKRHDELDFVLNEILPDAMKAQPDFWQAKWLSGALLVSKYNKGEGIPDLQAALAVNPSAVDVLVTLGEASLQDYDFRAGNQFADRALAVNAKSVPALLLKADIQLADSKTPDAEPFLKRALAVNPRSEAALGRLAAWRILSRKPDGVADLEKQALAVNPKPGDFYGALGDHLSRRLQFDLAESYYRKAIAAAPHLAGPLNGLGMLLMRVGKEDDARATFSQATKIDPYHVRVANMAKVLDHMRSYKTIDSPHFSVMVAPGDEFLGRYMSEYLESVYPTLVKRFAYEPKQKTKIEIMKTHQWFSGRVVGVPSIGTVGACTGKVVALASPSSMKQQKFNWARVLTHEVVHIITLEQTNFNIPHWYTEALAVLSEGFDRPQEWNALLAEREAGNKLFNLDNINDAFIRPKTPDDWQMAYCQSLLYAQYMLERFGNDALAKLLDAYRRGYETPVAVKESFKVDKADFEKGYRAYVKKLTAGLGSFAVAKPRSYAEAQRAFQAKPDDPNVAAELAELQFDRKKPDQARELAEAALAKQENHPGALLVLAKMEASIGRLDDAAKLLKRALQDKKPQPRVVEQLATVLIRQKKFNDAAELYDKAHRDDPLRSTWLEGYLLASLKLKESTGQYDDAKVRSALKRLSEMEADNLQVRKRLAEIHTTAKEWPEAERFAREVLYIEVADLAAHDMLGGALFEQKKYSAAAAEYELTAEKSESSAPGPRTLKAAEAFLLAKNLPKARQLLRSYITKNPGDAKAKDLMKKASGAEDGDL